MVLLLLALTTAVFSGCKRDKCKRVVCMNGACVDGTCECTAGWMGTDCGTMIKDQYIGSYTATEECRAGSDHYPVTIAADGASLTTVRLIGFWGVTGDTIVADLGADGLQGTIARQPLGNYEVDGSWISNDLHDEINVTFFVVEQGSIPLDQCTATFTKD